MSRTPESTAALVFGTLEQWASDNTFTPTGFQLLKAEPYLIGVAMFAADSDGDLKRNVLLLRCDPSEKETIEIAIKYEAEARNHLPRQEMY